MIDPARLRPEKSEVQRLISDNRNAMKKINWSPQVPFELGLQKTFDWVKSHLNLYSKTYTL